MNEPTNGTVSYTVKEILARVEGKVDTLIVAVALKVDRTEFDNLVRDVRSLQIARANQSTLTNAGKWAAGLGAGITAVLIGRYLP